jgi:hypothetical protein
MASWRARLLRRVPPRRRRSRRSRTTRSCPTAIRARWSPPMGRSTGSACRASTRPACSERCSTARRAPSAWVRSGQRPDGADLRTRYQQPRHRVERPDRLGAGARRADDGHAVTRGRDHPAHPATDRRRRRPRARAHRPVPAGQRRRRVGVRAGLRLWARGGRVVAGGRRPPCRRRERRRPDDQAADRHGDRGRGRAGQGPPHARAGRPGLLLALLGRGPGLAAEHR